MNKTTKRFDIVILGLGNAGTSIVEQVYKRKKYNSIRYVVASKRLDDLRKSSIPKKILIKDNHELRNIISTLTGAQIVTIVGDISSSITWIKILQNKVTMQSKSIYSFFIPTVQQSRSETDRYYKQIVELSTRSLFVPLGLFMVYSRYSGSQTFKELENLSNQFTRIAINSFLFLTEQFMLSDNTNCGENVKKLMKENGRMFFSIGSNSSDSVREAYYSPLISEYDMKSSRLKILHVQFKEPISLMTAHSLKKWVNKYKLGINSNLILMERNPNIDDIALSRLWVFE